MISMLRRCPGTLRRPADVQSARGIDHLLRLAATALRLIRRSAAERTSEPLTMMVTLTLPQALMVSLFKSAVPVFVLTLPSVTMAPAARQAAAPAMRRH